MVKPVHLHQHTRAACAHKSANMVSANMVPHSPSQRLTSASRRGAARQEPDREVLDLKLRMVVQSVSAVFRLLFLPSYRLTVSASLCFLSSYRLTFAVYRLTVFAVLPFYRFGIAVFLPSHRLTVFRLHHFCRLTVLPSRHRACFFSVLLSALPFLPSHRFERVVSRFEGHAKIWSSSSLEHLDAPETKQTTARGSFCASQMHLT